MAVRRKIWMGNWPLRLAGLILLGCCWLMARWLFHSPSLREHHDPTIAEFIVAAGSSLCFSAGTVLATLGVHIFDEIEISARWAKRSTSPDANVGLPRPIHQLAADDDVPAAFGGRVSAERLSWRVPAWRRPGDGQADK